MARRSVVTIEVDNIIDEAVGAFASDMTKSGNNLYLKLLPTVESLPVDEDNNILQIDVTGAVQDAVVEAFDTEVFQQRVNKLHRPFAKINEATVNDFVRKNGEMPAGVEDRVTGVTNEFKQAVDESFEDLDIDSGLVGPIVTIFNNSGTTESLKSNLKSRVPEIVVNFTTFRSSNLYDQYARRISQIYAEVYGLVWAKYEVVIDDKNRDFCRHRADRFWHNSEISAWGSMNWEGRIDGTNALNIDSLLGGYNCRHKLVWKKTSAVPEGTIQRWRDGRANNLGTI